MVSYINCIAFAIDPFLARACLTRAHAPLHVRDLLRPSRPLCGRPRGRSADSPATPHMGRAMGPGPGSGPCRQGINSKGSTRAL